MQQVVLKFQVRTVQAVMAGKDVLLLAPTGQGKSLTFQTAIYIKRLEKPKSVLLCCLPLDTVAQEKTRKALHCLPTVFITMGGKIVTNDSGEEEKDADISEDLFQAILRGDFAIIVSHAESWLSKTGRRLLKELKKRSMVEIVVFDESHKNLSWQMRPKMLEAPAVLKSKAPTASFLYLTATLKPDSISLAKEKWCMRSDLVTISASPILHNHFFLTLQRPSNRAGFDGILSGNSSSPALEDLLEVLLHPWMEDLQEDRRPKKLMLFCKVDSILHTKCIPYFSFAGRERHPQGHDVPGWSDARPGPAAGDLPLDCQLVQDREHQRSGDRG